MTFNLPNILTAGNCRLTNEESGLRKTYCGSFLISKYFQLKIQHVLPRQIHSI